MSTSTPISSKVGRHNYHCIVSKSAEIQRSYDPKNEKFEQYDNPIKKAVEKNIVVDDRC